MKDKLVNPPVSFSLSFYFISLIMFIYFEHHFQGCLQPYLEIPGQVPSLSQCCDWIMCSFFFEVSLSNHLIQRDFWKWPFTVGRSPMLFVN